MYSNYVMSNATCNVNVYITICTEIMLGVMIRVTLMFTVYYDYYVLQLCCMLRVTSM